jgi:hypothetical protein
MEFTDGEVVPEISLHAIIGSLHPKTMRVLGWIGGQKVVVLIDSGSIHNFVDSLVCKRAHLVVQKEKQIRVRVANGELVVSEGQCLQVLVQLSGFSFLTDTHVMPLAGCDMVLGIQWLVTLGSIAWDFRALTMEFTMVGNEFLLQGLAAPNLWEETDFSNVRDGCHKGLWLHLSDNVVNSGGVEQGPEFEALLDAFADLFKEPKGLPPSRSHDHAILLKSGSKPVCVRPYRYPYFSKKKKKRLKGLLRSYWSLMLLDLPKVHFHLLCCWLRKLMVYRECAWTIGP